MKNCLFFNPLKGPLDNISHGSFVRRAPWRFSLLEGHPVDQITKGHLIIFSWTGKNILSCFPNTVLPLPFLNETNLIIDILICGLMWFSSSLCLSHPYFLLSPWFLPLSPSDSPPVFFFSSRPRGGCGFFRSISWRGGGSWVLPEPFFPRTMLCSH